MLFFYSFHSSEGLVIIARGNTSNFITMLPQGNQSENYEVKLEAQIFDSLGDATTVKLIVQVRLKFTITFATPLKHMPILIPGDATSLLAGCQLITWPEPCVPVIKVLWIMYTGSWLSKWRPIVGEGVGVCNIEC